MDVNTVTILGTIANDADIRFLASGATKKLVRAIY